jgi:shikimate dehydrogenase
VTVPHKEHLVRLAREMAEGVEGGSGPDEVKRDARWTLDRLSRASGAGNTLVVKRDNTGAAVGLEVKNTDGPACILALTRMAGEGGGKINLGGRTVAVLGAGGTARALAAALLLEGAKVLVVNRTAQRAEELCADLRTALGETLGPQLDIRVADIATVTSSPVAAVVNCTTLGMRGPQQDQSALTATQLAELAKASPSCVVADCVYRPVQTRLLTDAAAAGLRTLDGVAMFVEQAAEQFAAWTGGPAPRGLFERSVREAVGEATERRSDGAT